MTRAMTKTRKTTPSSTGIAESSRRMMKRIIRVGDPPGGCAGSGDDGFAKGAAGGGAPHARYLRLGYDAGAGGGGFRNPLNRPGKYENELSRPLWSGLSASHWTAYDSTTSFASRVAPSWNVTPSRRVQVHWVSAAFGTHPVASAGMAAVPPIS